MKRLTITLDEDLYAKLEQSATNNLRSITKEIAFAIKTHTNSVILKTPKSPIKPLSVPEELEGLRSDYNEQEQQQNRWLNEYYAKLGKPPMYSPDGKVKLRDYDATIR